MQRLSVMLSRCNTSDHAAEHEKKEKDLTGRQASLQEGEQQLHAKKARLAALEETLKVCSVDSTPVILTFGHLAACCESLGCSVMLLKLLSCMDVLSAAALCLLPIISLQYQLSLHVDLDGCSLGHVAQQEHTAEQFE